MKLALVALALALTVLTASETAAGEVGLVELSIAVPHHDRDLQMAVLFPSAGQNQSLFAENAVFHGTVVHRDAPPLPGKYPLVLLSHGWGSNYARLAWLAAGLAEKGAIVLAVNHPGSTTGDLDFDTAFHHWTRAKDLSVGLDHLLQDPGFAPHIDSSRIYAAGFSYGGWTALSLAGVQGNRNGFFDYCEAAGAGSQFCAKLTAVGVDITAIDQQKYEASYKDTRISGVAAIDPGLTWNLTPKDVRNVTAPLLLLGLGAGGDRLAATDTRATGSGFEEVVPQATVKVVAPATHFTALGLCKPAGETILIEEQDDPVCTDPVGTDRAHVLGVIVAALGDHFGLE